MDYLQYYNTLPFYNSFNIVLNLIINGLPSIHTGMIEIRIDRMKSFKPYYKWITFNTLPKG